MAELDLRTMSERLRDAKHENICKRYKELCARYPEVKPYRCIYLISIEVNMTVPGVRNVLEKHGLYNNNKEI